MALAIENLHGKFVREFLANNHAETYLLVGGGRKILRDLAFECAKTILDTSGNVQEHSDCSVFDPLEIAEQTGKPIKGLRIEHVIHRKDGIQSIEQSLLYRPSHGAYRVVLVFDADHMTIDAQSALLKTTEEPPHKTILIFTAQNLHDLTPAFRSRCRVWRMPPVTNINNGGESVPKMEKLADLLPIFGDISFIAEMSTEEKELAIKVADNAFKALDKKMSLIDAVSFESVEDKKKSREQAFFELSVLRSIVSQATCLRDKEQVYWIDRIDYALEMLAAQVSPRIILDFLKEVEEL